jgi:hypothetical protein
VLLIDGVQTGYWICWPLVYTTQNYTLQITDIYRLVYSVYYSLHYPFPCYGFSQRTFFSFLHSDLPVTASHAELLSTDNSTNWVPGWRPFHTNLLVFSSQAHNLTLTNQLLHVSSLNWTAENFLCNLTDPAYNISARTTQNAPFPLL